MTEPPRPQAYPATPAYGAGLSPATGSAPPRRTSTRGTGWAVGLSLGVNVVTLVGVLALGWPAGNVFLLFWAENAVLGLITLVKVATARQPARNPITVNDRPVGSSPTLYALFFCLHYGIFCVVHLVFTAIVAWKVGIEPSFLLLGLPLLLVVVRYAVELATTWFGPHGQREAISPQTAMGQPYGRVIVLHVAVLLAFFVVLTGFAGGSPLGGVADALRPVLALLPVSWRTDGVAVTAILVGVKTVVDALTTRRALRAR